MKISCFCFCELFLDFFIELLRGFYASWHFHSLISIKLTVRLDGDNELLFVSYFISILELYRKLGTFVTDGAHVALEFNASFSLI